MFKKDKLSFGLILGFIAPVFGITLYYLLKFFPTFSISDFFSALKNQPSLISAIASLSLFANAALLTLYLNNRRDKTAIGIFIATLVYGLTSLILKLVL